MNPEGLLNKIITGDENALRQLFEQYSQRLYHVAYYYLQAKEPAEEGVISLTSLQVLVSTSSPYSRMFLIATVLYLL